MTADLTSRKLRLLRIIDSGSYDSPEEARDSPPGLESSTVGGDGDGDERVYRITGCVASQRYWQMLQPSAPPPDLILVDINFAEDSTSPLRIEERKIPTGLLHAIPFLAWARTSGRICSIAFQTGDPGLFTTTMGDASQTMKLLAAELAGLAGSIHGTLKKDEVVDRSRDRLVPKGDLELSSGGYQWIKSNAKTEERLALGRALAEYRHRLLESAAIEAGQFPRGGPAVVIDPQNHAALLRHADAASDRANEIVRPGSEGWPGLVFIRADGTRDSIAIESLFADAPGALKGRHFGSAVKHHPDQLWELFDGDPAVGIYLRQLGDWTEVLEQASRFALCLPLGDELSETKLLEAVSDGVTSCGDGKGPLSAPVRHERLVRFLTLAFHIVRQFQAARDAWDIQCCTAAWDAQNATFTDAPPPLNHPMLDGRTVQQTLPDFLTTLISDVFRESGRAEDGTYECDSLISILNKHTHGNKQTVEVYRRGLADLGVLQTERKSGALGGFDRHLIDVEHFTRVGAVVRKSQGLTVNHQALHTYLLRMIPSMSSMWVAPWITKDVVQTGVLARNTGCVTRNEKTGLTINQNSFSDLISNAFGVDRPQAKCILGAFQHGLPEMGWLRELCIQFAEKQLRWTNRTQWPRCLTGSTTV